jgi:hypothetical protein
VLVVDDEPAEPDDDPAEPGVDPPDVEPVPDGLVVTVDP